MPNEDTPNFETVPTDFEEYEKWAAEREGGTAAAPDEQPAEAKTDAESDTAEQQQEKDKQPQPETKKRSGFQRRLDSLNRKIGERDARIAELERRMQGGNATQTETPKPDEKKAPKPDANAKPDPKDFADYEQYIEALTDWKLERRDAKARETAQQSEAEKAERAVIEKHAERVNEAKKERLKDWDDVVVKGGEKIAITREMHQTIIESEHGPDIAYHLAKNPAEADRIAKLSPLRQIAELGKIEAAIEAKQSAPADTRRPRVSNAPAPAKTVRAQAETSEPDPKDFEAWERWRNAQPGASLRR